MIYMKSIDMIFQFCGYDLNQSLNIRNVFDSLQVQDMISYKSKIWIVFVAEQKSIGESDISTVKTITALH